LHRRACDRAPFASRRHGTEIGWERSWVVRTQRGYLQSEGEREGNWVFAAILGSEKTVAERERALGSGEAAKINGFNCLPRMHRIMCRFKSANLDN